MVAADAHQLAQLQAAVPEAIIRPPRGNHRARTRPARTFLVGGRAVPHEAHVYGGVCFLVSQAMQLREGTVVCSGFRKGAGPLRLLDRELSFVVMPLVVGAACLSNLLGVMTPN